MQILETTAFIGLFFYYFFVPVSANKQGQRSSKPAFSSRPFSNKPSVIWLAKRNLTVPPGRTTSVRYRLESSTATDIVVRQLQGSDVALRVTVSKEPGAIMIQAPEETLHQPAIFRFVVTPLGSGKVATFFTVSVSQ